jgi:DNA-binding transcriptional regulator YiaG
MNSTTTPSQRSRPRPRLRPGEYRLVRRAHRLSLKDVASLLNLSVDAVSAFERGRIPLPAAQLHVLRSLLIA